MPVFPNVLTKAFLGSVGEVIARAQTRASARSAIGAVGTSEVTVLVNEAIASDDTPAAAAALAAAAAVDEYVSGEMGLVQSSVEPNEDGDIIVVDDSQGRKTFRVDEDGITHVTFLNVAGRPLRATNSPKGYVSFYYDSEDRPSELVVSEETGCVPDYVLDRWAQRGGWGTNSQRDWILIAGGQSNMAGGDDDPPSGLYDTDPRLVKYDRDTDSLVPIGSFEGALYATLGRALLEVAPSDVRVIVINGSAGGTGFRSTSLSPPPAGYETVVRGTWDRTLTSDPINLYDRLVSDVTAVQSVSSNAKLVGLFWMQGEQDTTSMTQTEYAAALDDMIGAFRTAVDEAALPVIIGSMVPEFVTTSGRTAIQNALMDTPRRIARTSFVYGPKGMVRADGGAGIHFATAGQLDRARMFIRGIARARWNFTGARPTPPQDLRVTRSGTVLTAEYSPPPTRHTALVIEYTTNGGTTWTPMTKAAGAIGLVATATILTADVVQVRASATSDSTSGTTTSTYVYAST